MVVDSVESQYLQSMFVHENQTISVQYMNWKNLPGWDFSERFEIVLDSDGTPLDTLHYSNETIGYFIRDIIYTEDGCRYALLTESYSMQHPLKLLKMDSNGGKIWVHSQDELWGGGSRAGITQVAGHILLFTNPTYESTRIDIIDMESGVASQSITLDDLYCCYPDFSIGYDDSITVIAGNNEHLIEFQLTIDSDSVSVRNLDVPLGNNYFVDDAVLSIVNPSQIENGQIHGVYSRDGDLIQELDISADKRINLDRMNEGRLFVAYDSPLVEREGTELELFDAGSFPVTRLWQVVIEDDSINEIEAMSDGTAFLTTDSYSRLIKINSVGDIVFDIAHPLLTCMNSTNYGGKTVETGEYVHIFTYKSPARLTFSSSDGGYISQSNRLIDKIPGSIDRYQFSQSSESQIWLAWNHESLPDPLGEWQTSIKIQQINPYEAMDNQPEPLVTIALDPRDSEGLNCLSTPSTFASDGNGGVWLIDRKIVHINSDGDIIAGPNESSLDFNLQEIPRLLYQNTKLQQPPYPLIYFINDSLCFYTMDDEGILTDVPVTMPGDYRTYSEFVSDEQLVFASMTYGTTSDSVKLVGVDYHLSTYEEAALENCGRIEHIFWHDQELITIEFSSEDSTLHWAIWDEETMQPLSRFRIAENILPHYTSRRTPDRLIDSGVRVYHEQEELVIVYRTAPDDETRMLSMNTDGSMNWLREVDFTIFHDVKRDGDGGYWVVQSKSWGDPSINYIDNELEYVYDQNVQLAEWDVRYPKKHVMGDGNIAAIWERSNSLFMQVIERDCFTGIATPNSRLIPTNSGISSVWPNPFNNQFSVQFNLHQPSIVQFSIFNLLGQRLAVLNSGTHLAGSHDLNFHKEFDQLSSGVYFLEMKVNQENFHQKLYLLK